MKSPVSESTLAPFSSSYESLCRNVLSSDEGVLRVLMVGDVVGRPGRKVLKQVLHHMREVLFPDLVTINGENLAGGFGITEKIHDEMLECGVDIITMGNHWKDKKDIHALRRSSPALVVPQNIKGLEGVDQIPEFPMRRTHRVVRVVNLMGLFAMKDEYENPFHFLSRQQELLRSNRESGRSLVLTDVHAEASSEKQAIAWKMDGISAMQIGTHTHCPTADERILPGGTAFVSDVGMTGAYTSVIGMDVTKTLPRFFDPNRKKKGAHEVARGPGWFCGLLGEIDSATGLAVRAHRLQFRSDEGRWLIHSVGVNSAP